MKQLAAAGFTLFSLFSIGSAEAQIVPGVDQNRSRHVQESRANMLREANRVLGEWRTAWVSDDARTVTKFYTDNALVRLPDGLTVQGRPAIEQMLQDSLGVAGDLQIGMNDWEPGGDFVYISGPFTYSFAEPARTAITGIYVAVLKASGGGWKIRTQTFIPDPPTGTATSADS